VVITGVGGTGVVTVGAILAQAAQIDGKGAGMMEMAGLAQKGGAVHIHCRIAEKPRYQRRSASPWVRPMRDRRRSGGDGRGQDAGPDDARAAPARWSTATRSSPAISPATPNSAAVRPSGAGASGAVAGPARLFDASELARVTWAIRSIPT
jgi:hypothetical protein